MVSSGRAIAILEKLLRTTGNPYCPNPFLVSSRPTPFPVLLRDWHQRARPLRQDAAILPTGCRKPVASTWRGGFQFPWNQNRFQFPLNHNTALLVSGYDVCLKKPTFDYAGAGSGGGMIGSCGPPRPRNSLGVPHATAWCHILIARRLITATSAFLVRLRLPPLMR